MNTQKDNYTRVKEIEQVLIERANELRGESSYYIEEHLQTRLYEEVDRLVIYYSDCWDICKEAGATNFDIFELGRAAHTINELAFFTMIDEFYNITSMSIDRLAEEAGAGTTIKFNNS